MYVRNASFPNDTEKDKGIPENYSGYAMSTRNLPSEDPKEAQAKQDAPEKEYKEHREHKEYKEYKEEFPSAEECKATFKQEKECIPQKENRLFSSFFEKMGIKGAESSDITLLVIALLLLSGENDDYIWLLLLLLLLVN